MIMNEPIPGTESDEESLRDLLREAGARAAPPANVVNDVRLVVFKEWQQLVQQRRRTRFVRYGLAASMAAAVIAVLVVMQSMPPHGEPVATVARVDGVLQMGAPGGEEWQPALPGVSLPRDVVLRTEEGTRAALDMHGLSVRIDSGSLVRLERSDRITLDRGALYVDSGATPQSAASRLLAVDTLYGSVQHVGTQYALRVLQHGLSVSIREGRVQIDRDGRTYAGAAGEHIMVPREGAIQRGATTPQDPEWQWAMTVAPGFLIEHRPLSQFLDWVSRETGKPVVYASPEVRARAEQLILRGSVSDLPPEQALAAVLATTPFTQKQTGDSIRIEL